MRAAQVVHTPEELQAYLHNIYAALAERPSILLDQYLDNALELDVDARKIHLDISDEEMQRRLADWRPNVETPASGYAKLFHDHVEGADTGADFDFLKGCRGAGVGKDSH